MIDRYGDDALIEINSRIEELDQQNATEAHSLWLRIRQAAESLLERQEGKPKH